jgi:hypothetical protein
MVFIATLLSAMAFTGLAAFAYKVVWPYATSGVPPADWSLSTIVIATAAIIAPFAYLGLGVYRQYGTVIADSGISFPALGGRQSMAWSEITRVGVRGHELLFHTADRKFVLNTLYFADRHVLVAFLQSHLPGRVLNGDTAA